MMLYVLFASALLGPQLVFCALLSQQLFLQYLSFSTYIKKSCAKKYLYPPFPCRVTPPFCTLVTILLHVMFSFAESLFSSLFSPSLSYSFWFSSWNPLCGTTGIGRSTSSELKEQLAVFLKLIMQQWFTKLNKGDQDIQFTYSRS